jgi:DNA-binding CsgD family transcriptional regulator
VSSDEPLGRNRELEQVDRFLADVPLGPAALALTGPAGIGKTTVWQEGVHRAVAHGYVTLTTRPSAAEARLSYAAIADLLGSVDSNILAMLPSVQRRAIEVALLRAEAGTRGIDARIVGTAFHSVLDRLVAERPVVVAVDDAQWLDAASAEALAFTARRLGRLPVGVLVSVRVEGARAETFDTSLPAASRRDIILLPLNAAALHGILKLRLDVVFPRPTLIRIVEASGGNPFYAVEIARELQRMGVTNPGSRLPVPGQLRSLITARLQRLPPRTIQALLLAACLSQPTAELVDINDLAAAEEAGIVHVEAAGRIHFDHPLLAAAVYDSVPLAKRLQAHQHLARVVADPEERALHLAQATTAPDEAVAVTLEAAARQAAHEGATRTAARLARRAVELSPEAHGQAAIRRTIAAADYEELSASPPAETREHLEAALAECSDTNLRALLLQRLGAAAMSDGDLEAARDFYQRALDLAQDPVLAARIHAEMPWVMEKDKRLAIEHLDAGLELIEEANNPVLYSSMLMMRAYLRLVVGLGADDEVVERGRRLQVKNLDTSPVPMAWPALHDDFAEAIRRYEVAIEEARSFGDEHSEAALIATMAEIELWAGGWERADLLASLSLELIERSSSTRYMNSALYSRGYVDAHLGRVESARESAHRILANPARLPVDELRGGDQVLGFLAFSLRDYARAETHLSKAAAALERKQEWEPARFRFHPDLIEAVIMLGFLERAEALIDWLDARGRVFPRPWTFAMAARCRGLLLAARGDLDGALEYLQKAMVHQELLQMPFELARTTLALGQLLRRRNDRREARTRLGAALAEFERLGAPIWAERARTELARLPVRRAPAGLTPSEENIARLVASGLTNKEVAERAFVSPKTVEANLARVYDKLGVRSRAELGRIMAERGTATSR